MKLILSMLIFLLSATSFAQSKQDTLSGTIKVKKVETKLPESCECNCDADKKPSFPGGEKALQDFLAKAIMYPQAASEKNITGTVYVAFVINTKGEIYYPKIHKGLGNIFDEIAIHAVRAMPNWNPAKKGGKAVSCECVLPIKYPLNNKVDTLD